MKVKIKRIDKSLPLPKYQTEGSVGCDLYTRLTITIAPHTVGKIPTNVIIHTPPGFMFVVASRSSTPLKRGLIPANGIGIGDQDFCGPEDEYMFLAYNFTDKEVVVEKGDRVAQGIFVPIEVVEWDELEQTDKPNRGGLGSTGHK